MARKVRPARDQFLDFTLQNNLRIPGPGSISSARTSGGTRSQRPGVMWIGADGPQMITKPFAKSKP